MRDAISTYNEMRSASCAGNHEGVMLAFEELMSRHRGETAPLNLRIPLYHEELAALANRGKYETLDEGEVSRIAAAIDEWGHKECAGTYLNLAVCYIILKRPEEAKKRALHAIHLLQGGTLPDDFSYQRAFRLILIACLSDPQRATVNDKVQSAMATLNECELIYLVSYSDITTSLSDENRYGFVQFLRINNPDVFGAAYDQLGQEIVKTQATVHVEERNNGWYLMGSLKRDGKPVTKLQFLRPLSEKKSDKEPGPPPPDGRPGGDC
jgi:hypothetical protein